MGTILKNYRGTVSLLIGVIIGGVVGVLLKEKAVFLDPFGQLFLNLMYMVLIPLVFFSIANAIGQTDNKGRLGKILGATVLVFLFTSIVAAIIGYLGVRLFPIIGSSDIDSLKNLMGSISKQQESTSFLQQIVNLFTVDDFSKLLSKDNMLPMIVFSLFVGLATSSCGAKAQPFRDFLSSGNEIILKVVKFIMYYAPIGLGCYFAVIVGSLGSKIINGYLHSFILYLGLSAVYFGGVMTVYAFIAYKKDGVQAFWKHILVPAATALATSSSAASIPANLAYGKKMGIDDDIVDTVIPLGANIHKDGSVIGGIFKITFLFLLFGRDITSPLNILQIIFTGFFVGAVMGAIPGGGLVAETLIVSLFAFPVNAIPLIVIISTIIDIPATLLNSTSNVASALMVNRLVGKKTLRGS